MSLREGHASTMANRLKEIYEANVGNVVEQYVKQNISSEMALDLKLRGAMERDFYFGFLTSKFPVELR